MSESCYCDFEAPKIYSKREPTARIEHDCYECGSKIKPGEKYEYVFGVWDYPDTFKTCPKCLGLRIFLQDNVPCFCFSHGSLFEDAIETAHEYGKIGDGLLFGTLRRIAVIKKSITDKEQKQ